MWKLKYDTNDPIYKTNRIMDIENRLVVDKEGLREGYSRKLGLADVDFYRENE